VMVFDQAFLIFERVFFQFQNHKNFVGNVIILREPSVFAVSKPKPEMRVIICVPENKSGRKPVFRNGFQTCADEP
jgi:hypothetical protein